MPPGPGVYSQALLDGPRRPIRPQIRVSPRTERRQWRVSDFSALFPRPGAAYFDFVIGNYVRGGIPKRSFTRTRIASAGAGSGG